MLPIIDSDRHVLEPESIWKQYTEIDIHNEFPVHYVEDDYPQLIQRAQNFGTDAVVKLPPKLMIGNYPLLRNWGTREAVASAHKGKTIQNKLGAATLAQTQISSMDQSGIQKAYMFPTIGMYVVNHMYLPAHASLAYADAYNRWLKDYCSNYPDRLYPVGLISRHQPQNMIEQLNRIVQYGWSCITLRPEVIADKDLGHKDYDEFWSACEDNNIAVAFHGGTNLYAPTAGSERFQSRFALHACSHMIEAQMAFLALLESGVFEHHSRLKVAFLEAGSSWLPSWLWRLDNICYPEFPSLISKNIKQLPSDYFRHHCWINVEPSEPCLSDVIATIGDKKLLYGTDFPHPDHLHLIEQPIEQQLAPLSGSILENILTHNAFDFFTKPLKGNNQEGKNVNMPNNKNTLFTAVK